MKLPCDELHTVLTLGDTVIVVSEGWDANSA